MPREYIYLNEGNVPTADGPVSDQGNPKAITPEAGNRRLQEIDTDNKNRKENIRNHLGDIGKEVSTIKNNTIEKGKIKKAMNANAKLAATQAQNTSSSNKNEASMLDEENDDASIIDNKSTEEQKEIAKNNTLNEKLPLQEFMNIIKQIFES